jgi:hypothetical protein
MGASFNQLQSRAQSPSTSSSKYIAGFTRVPFVFTRVHSCSIRVHSCSIRVNSCSIRVHSCSIRVHSCSFVFTRVHLCSLVFWLVWSFRSDPRNLRKLYLPPMRSIFCACRKHAKTGKSPPHYQMPHHMEDLERQIPYSIPGEDLKSNSRGMPGGMMKFRIDRYIAWHTSPPTPPSL